MIASEYKVLIVDDSKNIRKLITVVLKNEGYKFSEAENGVEALEKIRLERPDLIILDIIIPGVDGLRVCKEVKSDPATKDISIIILTSEATYEAREKASAAGADAFLSKPFDPKVLKRLVRDMAQNSFNLL